MTMLAIDTATAGCAVCVVRDDGAVFEHRPSPDRLFTRPAHTRELLPAIDTALHESGCGFADLDAVAVGVGPGAFTGLRIGVATARAIASARGLALVPVSSLAALARGAGALDDESQLIVAVIDARRQEYFCGAYALGGASVVDDDVAGEDGVVEMVRAVSGDKEVVAVGDGAVKLSAVLNRAGAHVPPATDPRHVVTAAAIAQLAVAAPAVAVNAVLPNYIREPDAKVSTRESWITTAPANVEAAQ